MCIKALILNKNKFGSLSICGCGTYYLKINRLTWRFSKKELKATIKTIQNINIDDWEFEIHTLKFQIKIPLTSEISTRYLICNENEFNCLKFIINEHLVIDQLLNKSTDQFQLN